MNRSDQPGVPKVPSRTWRSLRARLAGLGFLAIYVPVILLAAVTLATEREVVATGSGPDAVEVETIETSGLARSPWVTWTVVALGPVAAGLAWWWAGRAVRPIEQVRAVAEDIEGSDLSRRIGLKQGPTEVVALAASFDAMLGRLERAADTQRRLVEETSHELRTPLSVLTTNADVLLDHSEPTVEIYREGLERSKNAAARMRITIDELLVDARGRARTLDRQPADLVAVVHDVVDRARPLAEAANVSLTSSGPPTLACALDEPTVNRALSNLVDNAIRFASRGSTVNIDVQADTASNEVSVAVADHGPGIPTDQQEHIFERFWSGRREDVGTGLGLPIARQVARAHGGDITLTSPGPSGDGCVFRLTMRCS